MRIMFANRRDELAFLESLYSSGKKEALILCGRRRVGKTELVKRFITGKLSIYFLANMGGLELNARRFYSEVAEGLGLSRLKVWDFQEAFELIKLKVPHRVSEIAQYAVTEVKDMPKYLRTLIFLGLVRANRWEKLRS
ncbi:hypothetical protein [Thermococcus sp.]|uniref:hypothetical protein n=1 Tax=Thermococcus sp. TaxID=35749 RepID=UPI00262008AF|nr:hypothetical protein [Thermococcus sp.]